MSRSFSEFVVESRLVALHFDRSLSRVCQKSLMCKKIYITGAEMSVRSKRSQRKTQKQQKNLHDTPDSDKRHHLHTQPSLPNISTFSSRRRLRPTPQHLTKCPVPFINKSIRELRDLIGRRRLTCPHSRLRRLVTRVVRQ